MKTHGDFVCGVKRDASLGCVKGALDFTYVIYVFNLRLKITWLFRALFIVSHCNIKLFRCSVASVVILYNS